MKTSRCSVLLVLVAIAVLVSPPAAAQSNNWWEAGYQKEESTPTHTVQYTGNPGGKQTRFETDWVAGEAKFCTIGVADVRKAGGEAMAKRNAERAAEVSALADLGESVQGVTVSRTTTVREGTLESEVAQTSYRGFLKGVQFTPPQFTSYPDGSVAAEVCAGFNLYGEGGMYGKLADGIPAGDAGPGVPRGKPDPAPSPPKPHTGVIVDASGLSLRPGLSPRIVTETGREVYGAMDVPREWALEHAVVAYHASVGDAKETKDRIGENPLVVKGVKPYEEGGIDVVVSAEDAGKILAADRDSKALSEARVIFVLN